MQSANGSSNANSQKADKAGHSFLDTLMAAANMGQQGSTALAQSSKAFDHATNSGDKGSSTGSKKTAKDSHESDDSAQAQSANAQDQTQTAQVNAQPDQQPAETKISGLLHKAFHAVSGLVEKLPILEVALPVTGLDSLAASVGQSVAQSVIQSAGPDGQAAEGSEAIEGQEELAQAMAAIQANLTQDANAGQGLSVDQSVSGVLGQQATSAVQNKKTLSGLSDAVADATVSSAVSAVNDGQSLVTAETVASQLAAIIQQDVRPSQTELASNANAATAKVEGKLDAKVTGSGDASLLAVNANALQAKAQSGVDSRQTQSGSDSQGQTGTAAHERERGEKSFASAAITDAVQTQNATVPVQAHAAEAKSSALTDNTAQPPVPAAASGGAQQTAEAAMQISTARLIQTASQAEMRVGMTSSEFGNISISASSTRDAVTAQISVDNTELAKTLSAQLTEFHAKPGAQPMEVRIDMHSTGMNFGQGTSSQADGSANQSYSGRQQQSAASNSYSSAAVATQRPVAAIVAAQASGRLSLGERLDITA